ncbi:MAG: DUF2782 domain-containing protein [Magnetococcales bacterium]|nr:DUF2782 domain-containing protein [Magnetococcales bacterium]MBF0420312.1 DUF2782 domain-containing protein [Magnetococcales bacterium]MBF0435618.1 DUF2782 domain-containing protein [Magnetococcales bacterium]
MSHSMTTRGIFRPRRLLPLVLLLLLCPFLSASAEQPLVNPKGFPVPEKGHMVSQFKEKASDEPNAPETVVRKYEDEQGNQVFEFFINGSLFELQVIPVHGPPYLLIDTNGDGLFDSKFNGHQPRLVVPQWVLFRF